MRFPSGTPADGDVPVYRSSDGLVHWEEAPGGDVSGLQAQIDAINAQLLALGVGIAADPSLVPSYTNTDGRGNRSASVTVTAFPTGLLYYDALGEGRLVDGAFYFDTWLPANTSPVGSYIAFDFGVPVFITEAKFYMSALGGSPPPHLFGNWQWEGSNDGSTWSTIGGVFEIDTDYLVTEADPGNPGDGSTRLIFGTLSANKFMWQHYRMKCVGGGWSVASYYIFEVEFKIDR